MEENDNDEAINLLDMMFPPELQNKKNQADTRPDVDSIYGVSRNKADRVRLVKSLLTNKDAIVKIQSTLSRTRTSTTSRINFHFENQSFISGTTDKQLVSPNKLPSLRFCEIVSNSVSIYVSLHHVSRKFLNSNYFSNLELACILGCMNFSKLMAGQERDNCLGTINKIPFEEKKSYLSRLLSKPWFSGSSSSQGTIHQKSTELEYTGKHFLLLFSSMFELLELFSDEERLETVCGLIGKNPWDFEFHEMSAPGTGRRFQKTEFKNCCGMLSQKLIVLVQAAGTKERLGPSRFGSTVVQSPDYPLKNKVHYSILSKSIKQVQKNWSNFLKTSLEESRDLVLNIFDWSVLSDDDE